MRLCEANSTSRVTGGAVAIGFVLAMIALASCATARSKARNIESVVASVSERLGKQPFVIGPVSGELHKFRMLTAKGAPRDLGRAIGMMGIEVGAPFPEVLAQYRENNAATIALYREIYPAYVERAAGVAEAYGRKLEDLDIVVIEGKYVSRMWEDTYGRLSPAEQIPFPSCSGVGVQVPDGRTVVGRNLDDINRTYFLVRSEVEGCYKSISASFAAFDEDVLDGMNEKGLFVGEMTIGDPAYGANLWNAYPQQPSVYFLHMMRVILDTCANVEQAIALFKRVPVWFTNELWHFYAVDQSGDFAVIEWGKDRQLSVTRQKGGVLISMNTALMEGRESLMKDWRYAYADKYIAERGVEGIATHASMAELMRRVSIRSDNSVMPADIIGTRATVWTSTYDLADRTMVIRYWEDRYKEHRLTF
jgi:hypothetical protein